MPASPWARAANEPQQERLSLVVAWPSANDVGLQRQPGALEPKVSGRARRLLDRLPIAPRAGRDIFPFDDHRPAERLGEPQRKLLVASGRVAQLVIEVHDPRRAQLARGIERPDDMRQRDGVGSARRATTAPRPASWCCATKRRTRASTAAWCRGRIRNRRPRAYETRALTS